jgi:hypothetical protein
MKAANVERALRGDSPAYGELHFHEVEQDLEHYSAQLQKVL